MPSRTASLLSCLLVAGSTGFIYDFSIYSGALKQQFHFSQSQLDWIATSGAFTFFVSPISGHFVDTFGPRPGVLIAGTCMTIGLTLQYLFSRQYIFTRYSQDATSAMAILCACACLTTIGANCAASVAFSSPVKLFPQHRGRVTGIVKAFAGLSGGLLAQMYTLSVGLPSKQPETLSFLLYLAGACLFLNIVVSPWLFPVGKLPVQNSPEHNVRARLQQGYGVVLLLIVSIFVCSLLTAVPALPHSSNSSGHPPHPAPNATAAAAAIIATQSPAAIVAIGMFLVMMLAVGVAVSFSFSFSCSSWRSCRSTTTTTTIRATSQRKEQENARPNQLHHLLLQPDDFSSNDVQVKDVGTCTMLSTVDFWLVLTAGMSAVGGGYMITTNSYQIVQSSLINGASADTAISMFSACQGLSRMIGGVGPETIGANRGDAAAQWRPLFLAGFCLVMVMGHFLLWFGPRTGNMALLYAGYCLAGVGFGGVWPLMVTISADCWGLTHLGANYMVFDGSTALVGSLVMGKLLPQAVYVANGGGKNHGGCLGAGCFGNAHLVLTAVNLVGAVAAGVLWLRRRRVLCEER